MYTADLMDIAEKYDVSLHAFADDMQSYIYARDVHGLDSSMDWIGSDDCYVQNFDCLCFSPKQTETVLCNN